MRGSLELALAAMLGCSTSSDKPPLLPPGDPGSGAICQLGADCPDGSYCWAVADSGCSVLTCPGSAWVCLKDAGPRPDVYLPVDAGGD